MKDGPTAVKNTYQRMMTFNETYAKGFTKRGEIKCSFKNLKKHFGTPNAIIDTPGTTVMWVVSVTDGNSEIVMSIYNDEKTMGIKLEQNELWSVGGQFNFRLLFRSIRQFSGVKGVE